MTPTLHRPRIATFFSYDWDALGFARQSQSMDFDTAGFDLFSFPSNARIVGFDLDRFADQQAARGRARGWSGVVSHHEQYGVLAAALVAERLGLPGTSPESVVAAQHKLHARRVLDEVAPEANLAYADLDAVYGGEVPDGLTYPAFVKPVKAAFSVLAKHVRNRDELRAHTRFGRRELWVIRRLVEPFERVARQRIAGLSTAHRMLLETALPIGTPQFNLDGYVFNGDCQPIGVVDAVMYPGTQAFMRWEYPSKLASGVQAQALDVARRFLKKVGFTNGLFNMEFFHDAKTRKLSVIEFNPRLASQFSDMYMRVDGIDPHAWSLALAQGQDPRTVPALTPSGKVAASLVYRSFSAAATPPTPSRAQKAAFARAFPDGMLFPFPKRGHSLDRDFKWLGSHRYGIIHLSGRSDSDLRERCERASGMLGWPAPYADQLSNRLAGRWPQDGVLES